MSEIKNLIEELYKKKKEKSKNIGFKDDILDRIPPEVVKKAIKK